MSRNVNRITNHYNLIQARADWDYVAARAKAAGASALVAMHYPPEGAGWRKIDKAIGAVRAVMGWPLVFEMRKADANLSEDIKDALGYLDGVIGTGKVQR